MAEDGRNKVSLPSFGAYVCFLVCLHTQTDMALCWSRVLFPLECSCPME